MYLTTRSVWWCAGGILLTLAFPRLATVIGWVLVVTVACFIDVLAAPSPRRMTVRRQVGPAVRLGQSTTASLTITSNVSREASLEVRDAWSPSAGAASECHTMTLAARSSRRVITPLTPTRRGDRPADLVTIRSAGPLGLAGRQVSLVAPAHVRALPPFTSRRHLPSRLARLREMDGRSAVMVRGAGTEFDSLREYVIGDDVRSIDWRSTARRGEVVVRTWRPERDRRVLILVDTSRLAAARLGDETRLDAQIEATLLMAALTSHAGDRIDVVAVDDQVRAQVRGESGPALMSALADCLAPVEPTLTETDWALVSEVVRRTLSQRALVVLLTGLDGAGLDPDMLRAVGTLARDHTVLLASATDPGIEELRTTRDDSESVYLAAAAERDLLEVDAVRTDLRRLGVEVVEAVPQELGPRLADSYLALKAAGRL